MARSVDQQPDTNRVGEPSVSNTDMSRWIQAARDGDRESLGELFQQCRGYLLAIAHAELDDTLRGKLAVSDIVQETLMRVQQNFAGFRGAGEDELLTWLRQILSNYLIDVRRAYRGTEKRNVQREIQRPSTEDTAGHEWDGMVVDSMTPGRAASATEEIERLRAAMANMSEEYRTVLTLRTWERQSFEQVGHQMGRTADAARMLWARAVKQLTAQLKSDDECSS